jgi:L-ribulose-5-phosphate 3-epimerase
MHEIGIYEKALNPAMDIFNKIEEVSRLGFKGIEISIDGSNLKPYTWDSSMRKEILSCLSHHNLKIFSICLSAHRYFGLAIHIPEMRKFALSLLIDTIIFARDLHCDTVLVSGYDTCNTIPPSNSWELYKMAIVEALKVAEKYEIELAIENVDGNFINSAQKAKTMVEEIDHPNLKIYLDLANAKAHGFDPVDEIATAGTHIGRIHAKDCIGSDFKCNALLGSGEVDFVECFKALGRVQFKGKIILENWYENEYDMEKYIKDKNYLENLIHTYLS